MTEKSTTCFKKKDGTPLTVYRSEHDALAGANYSNSEYRLDLYPYKCQRCGFWHLAPKDRQTPSQHCSFCGKSLYSTREAAEKRAMIIEREEGVKLRVYKCEYYNGWHLTKSL